MTILSLHLTRRTAIIGLAFLAVTLVTFPSITKADPAIPSIIGKWTADAPDGDKLGHVFKDDMTVIWIVGPPDAIKTIHAKYRVDYTTSPKHIDIFAFDQPALANATFLGIFEFQDDSHIKFFGESARSDNEAKRPSQFGDNSIILTKIPQH